MSTYNVIYLKHTHKGEKVGIKEVRAFTPNSAAQKLTRNWKTGTIRQEVIEVQTLDGTSLLIFQ